MNTYRKTAAVLAAAVAAAIFTLYETSPGTAVSTPSTGQVQPAVPGNPVTILALMHVPIPSGETVGQVDAYGDRYAVGTFASGEQVTVNTFASDQALSADLARNSAPSDVNKVLVGPLFDVWVTGVDDGNGGTSFPVPLATLAQESGTSVAQ